MLCEQCKIYNIDKNINKCLCCGAVIKDACATCVLPYERSWVVGGRAAGLDKLVESLKYRSIRALAWPLAEMMEGVLPCLPEDTIVVPVPTIARHVRERGLDHTWLVGKKLARLRGWRCERLVGRISDTVQVGVGAKQRRKQAKEAYGLVGEVDEGRHYLVLDDVCTTGASLAAVCDVLKKGGAQNISVVVLVKSGN